MEPGLEIVDDLHEVGFARFAEQAVKVANHLVEKVARGAGNRGGLRGVIAKERALRKVGSFGNVGGRQAAKAFINYALNRGLMQFLQGLLSPFGLRQPKGAVY